MDQTKPLGSSLEHRFYALNSKYSLLPPPFPQASIPSANSPSSPWERRAPSPRTAVMPWAAESLGRRCSCTLGEQNSLHSCRSTPKPLLRVTPAMLTHGPTLHGLQHSTWSPWAQWVFTALYFLFFPHIILKFKYKYSNTGHMRIALRQFSFRLFYNSNQRNAAESRAHFPFQNLHFTWETPN